MNKDPRMTPLAWGVHEILNSLPTLFLEETKEITMSAVIELKKQDIRKETDTGSSPTCLRERSRSPETTICSGACGL